MSEYLKGRVAIVTGAGSGLGRAHAIALARHGARVVVNNLATAQGQSAAHCVVDEIVDRGGEAIANDGDVTNFGEMQEMIAQAVSKWGRVDILVNNAGVLRDKTFAKMSIDDFRQVIEVHLMGSVNCTKAVWEQMRAQNYGRIVMTTSSSGLYGNFGQSNYSAAKMGVVGLMQTLAIEGAKHDIRVNCLAPSAATAMTEGIMPNEALARLHPAAVSPGLIAIVGQDAPTRTILLAGAGSFESAHITMTQGIFLGEAEDPAAQLRARFDQVTARDGEVVPGTGFDQCRHELSKAGTDVLALLFGPQNCNDPTVVASGAADTGRA